MPRLLAKDGRRVNVPDSLLADKLDEGFVVDPFPDETPNLHKSTPGRHVGRAAFIAGCGPSMAMVRRDAITNFVRENNCVLWVVNSPWNVCNGLPLNGADYLLMLDENFWISNRDKIVVYLLENPQCLLVVGWQLQEDRKYQRIAINIGAEAKTNPQYRVNSYFHGNSSGVAAIQMALHCGCNPIYLLGHDCTISNGMTHGNGVRRESELVNKYPQGKTMVDGYNHVAKQAKELGRRVVNLSPCSCLTCFDRQELRQ